MRIVSLYPAATEIIYALGQQDDLVGVSDDCRFPADATTEPHLAKWGLVSEATESAEIDRWASERLARGEPSFQFDRKLLAALSPELVIVQGLCGVCAPTPESIAGVIATLERPPRVLNLKGATLAGMLDDIRRLGEALGVPDRAGRVLAGLQQRIAAVTERVAQARQRPRVAVLEWLDPVYGSGSWIPELVLLAGGTALLGDAGKSSVRTSWAAVHEAHPDVLLVACCGQDLDRIARDWARATVRPEVQAIQAVRDRSVYLTDGNRFCQPGPRLIETLEALASILHPDLFTSSRVNRADWHRAEGDLEPRRPIQSQSATDVRV